MKKAKTISKLPKIGSKVDISNKQIKFKINNLIKNDKKWNNGTQIFDKKVIQNLNEQNKNITNIKLYNKKLKNNQCNNYLNIKPKIKKSKNVVNGTLSYIINTEDKKINKSIKKNRNKDLDVFNNFFEYDFNKFLKIKNKKGISKKILKYNEDKLDQKIKIIFDNFSKEKIEDILIKFNKINDKKKNSKNDKFREKIINYLEKNHLNIVFTIKKNLSILKNYFNYLGYLKKVEFFNTLESIGIKFNKNIFNNLFWLFDLKGDGIIDEEEFDKISKYFKNQTFEEKIRSNLKRILSMM